MKRLLRLFFVLLLISCSATKKLAEPQSQPTKFIFKKSIITSAEASSKLISKTDSLIDAIYDLNSTDSLTNLKLKELQMVELLTQPPPLEIIIEVQNDSIWRHTKQNGNMIGDFILLQKSNGAANYYDKSKTVNYSELDLFVHNDSYQVIEDRNSKKIINGFNCYKLTLIRKNSQTDFGNTIYAMYVTNEIDLPIHSVINLTKLVPNTFPLEISVSEEKFPGLAEQYVLIKME